MRAPAHAVAQAVLRLRPPDRRALRQPLRAPQPHRPRRRWPDRAAAAARPRQRRCAIGLESTVVSLLGGPPRRAPAPTRAEIKALIGPLAGPKPTPRSPERLTRHAPAAPLRLDAEAPRAGEAFLAFGPAPSGPAVFNLSPTRDLAEAAANLFSHLRAADALSLAAIAVAPIPEEGLGEAINDRLRRAAGYVG